MKATSTTIYTPEQILRILKEHQLLFSAQELCERWKIRPGTLTRWKKQYAPWRKPYTLRDLLIIVLYQGGGRAQDMISYLDYRDHAIYSETELETELRGLERDGFARKEGERWVYNKSRISEEQRFIF